MAFIDYQQHIFGEIIQQAIRWCTCLTPIEITAIVLYTRAIAQFLNHLNIVFHPFLYALCIQRLAQFLEVKYLRGQVQFDLRYGCCRLVGISAEDGRGIDIILLKLINHFPRHHIQRCDAVYLVAEKFNAQDIIRIRQRDIHGITFHTEPPTRQLRIIAHILHIHQEFQ